MPANQVESVVIRFSGDSGDGMQLTGTQFSNTSAIMGNDISTFPDFPAEIRAPAGTVAGVSGFQIQLGSQEISTPGDEPDVLVAMNPAALKANWGATRKGGTIIVDMDSFKDKNFEKLGFKENPLKDGSLSDYQVIEANITRQTLEALKDSPLKPKFKERCKNLYALGMTYYIFGRDLDVTLNWIGKKFSKLPDVVDANQKALKAGFNYAETVEATISTFKIPPAKIEPGLYRSISGNQALAWGLVQGAKAAGVDLFLGSYPITPASDILHELSRFKKFGVKTFQAEDEIAGICAAIGASFAGALGLTTSSGPGIALKGEAIGYATMVELPLVIVDVQRGGPSTGLPTKTEQSDLNLALSGRNGECPVVVIAARSPKNCFHMGFEAARIALEHMSPVVLLSDGYIANGVEPWKIPDLKPYSKVKTRFIDPKIDSPENFAAFSRDEETLARPWAIPGVPGFENRVGGLEKEHPTGNVSYDPENHEKMVGLRAEKIDRIANYIPLQEVEGNEKGDLLVVSWGGTYGAAHSAVKKVQSQGKKVSLASIQYLNPFPKNLLQVINNYEKILVVELNTGQLRRHLRAVFGKDATPRINGYHKVQGLPFKISELVTEINLQLEGKN